MTMNLRKRTYLFVLGLNVALSFLLYSNWLSMHFLSSTTTTTKVYNNINNNTNINNNVTNAVTVPSYLATASLNFLTRMTTTTTTKTTKTSTATSSSSSSFHNGHKNTSITFGTMTTSTIPTDSATTTANFDDVDNDIDINIIVPIIVDLTGELGNHLLHLAHGRAIQIMAKKYYNITTRLILRQVSTSSKYQSTKKALQTCFLNLRNVTFHKPSSLLNNKNLHQLLKDYDKDDDDTNNTDDDIDDLLSQQQELWEQVIIRSNNHNHDSKLQQQQQPWILPSGTDYATTRKVVDQLAQIVHYVTIQQKQQQQQQHQQLYFNNTNNNNNTTNSFPILQTTNETLSSPSSSNTTTTKIMPPKRIVKGVPFLQTTNMINREFMDLFYDDYRSFFQFDDVQCCADLPQPDEIVFHFRNFVGELSKQGKKSGLEELSPNKTATELFAHDKTNLSKIVIATRNPKDPTVLQYVSALTRSNNNNNDDSMIPSSSSLSSRSVRIFSNHSSVQDFCAMRYATELVGTARSTFVVWAALLGNHQYQQSVRLYSVDSLMARKRSAKKNNAPIFRTYNWTHPELQRRIHFELYQAEDVE